MKVSSGEIIVIILLMVFLAFSSYFLVDARLQDKVVIFNFSKGVKNVVMAVNGSSNVSVNSSVVKAVVATTTTSVTSSTIRIMFINSKGSASTVIKSDGGNVIVNCGRNISIADRLFMADVVGIDTALVTRLDEYHAGACARLFMLMPPRTVFDSTEADSGVYLSNYIFAVGGKRMPLEDGVSFAVGNIGGRVIRSGMDGVAVMFVFGNISYMYVDDCNDACLESVIPKSSFVNVLMITDSGNIAEDKITSMLPLFVAARNVSSDTVAVAQKYGIKVVDMNDGDFSVNSDGNIVEWKK